MKLVLVLLAVLAVSGCSETSSAAYRDCITHGTPAQICAARVGYEDGSN